MITGKVHIWFWIRTRLPTRVWKRCMEFKSKTSAGKEETFFIDGKTGTTHKVQCDMFHTFVANGRTKIINDVCEAEHCPTDFVLQFDPP